MSVSRTMTFMLFLALCFSSIHALQEQKITIVKELDDDHILIRTNDNILMYLEKWDVRLSPIIFEGKIFKAQITPLWVTIYFDNRRPIKWSIVEKYEGFSSFEESNITGTISGTINTDSIFKTTSGNIYQVSQPVIMVVVAVMPEVVVFKKNNMYLLVVSDFDQPLMCTRLNQSNYTSGGTQSNIVHSFITNDFEGLDYGNIYMLANGQVWEQIDPYIYIYLYINPPVIIYSKGGTFFMKVDISSIPRAVQVKRIK